jgi:hypothetical protein
MSNTDERRARSQFQPGPLLTGAALIGLGALLAMAGVAVGGTHLISAMRRWVADMEVPPSELATMKLAQARAAAAAGAQAWQQPPASRETAG